MAKFALEEGRHFTMTVLVKYLNKKFENKTIGGKEGKQFTIGDVQHYITRGYLPKKYGGNTIKVIKSTKIGIRIFELSKD